MQQKKNLTHTSSQNTYKHDGKKNKKFKQKNNFKIQLEFFWA
jgi:hypothetical protein